MTMKTVTTLPTDRPQPDPDAKLRDMLWEVARVERARMDRLILKAAESLVDVLRKEVDGTRDGDGLWIGSDPVQHAIDELREVLAAADHRRAEILGAAVRPELGSGLPF